MGQKGPIRWQSAPVALLGGTRGNPSVDHPGRALTETRVPRAKGPNSHTLGRLVHYRAYRILLPTTDRLPTTQEGAFATKIAAPRATQ